MEHNERIAAKRLKVCNEFIETTSTNLTTAKHYCQMTAYDLERAVSLFYDAGGGIPLGDSDDDDDVDEQQEQENSAAAAADSSSISSPGDDDDLDQEDPISSIMKSAKKQEPSSSSSSKKNAFTGKGFSLNNNDSSLSASSGKSGADGLSSSSSQELKIRIVFYKDGFTSQEEEEPKQEKVPSIRQRGIHSFDPQQQSLINKYLPPIRDYESTINIQFINDVQQSKVPIEYRRLDDNRRPIPVSILLDDRRSTNYPINEWELQEASKKYHSFGGTGQTLGGNNKKSSPTTERPSNQMLGGEGNNNSNNNNSNILIFLRNIIESIWKFLLLVLKKIFHSPKILEKHVVNPNKPTTTLAIRWQQQSASGINNQKQQKQQVRRERVVFNVDHTIQDLYVYCLTGLHNINDNDGEERHRQSRSSVITEEDLLQQNQQQQIEIMSGFPPKSILGLNNIVTNTASTNEDKNNMKMTLQEAGLLNSAVEIRILSTSEEKRND